MLTTPVRLSSTDHQDHQDRLSYHHPPHPLPRVFLAQPRSPLLGDVFNLVWSEFLTNGAPPTTQCTPPSLQRRCSLDLQPSRAGIRGAPRLLAHCAAGGARTLGCGCGKSRAEAPPRRAPPAARPLGRGAGQRAERRGALAARTPTTPRPPSLRHPGCPRAPDRRPEAALQVKADSVVGVWAGGAPPEGRMQPGVQPRRGAAPQAPVREQDLQATRAGVWPRMRGCSPFPWT